MALTETFEYDCEDSRPLQGGANTRIRIIKDGE